MLYMASDGKSADPGRSPSQSHSPSCRHRRRPGRVDGGRNPRPGRRRGRRSTTACRRSGANSCSPGAAGSTSRTAKSSTGFSAATAPPSRACGRRSRRFSPADLIAWCEGLGQPTFVGSSGRVFPKAMKTSPLLRAWLERLRAVGRAFKLRHHWRGWDDERRIAFRHVPTAPSRSSRTRRCWRLAARAGRGSAPTAAGPSALTGAGIAVRELQARQLRVHGQLVGRASRAGSQASR